ncbi:MAG TPA: xanthine dehydrogenase family protein subunit M [Thermomicrobiales bacterium]|nr:xanthine dehydrogenase family protein subunit M [Thermomicrobiales bacterium]
MFPSSFANHRAASVADALAQLDANEDAKILAGGHSLIPAMKLRLAMPSMLVDIGRIPDLKSLYVGDEIHIGAMATYNEIRDHEEIASLLPILPQAIAVLGDQQVRARGTFGGAVAHADPAADLPAVFAALNGRVRVQGSAGEREIAADDLFVDLWTTSIEPNEILTEVIIPIPESGTRMAYAKHPHPASGYAVVGVAAVVPMRDGTVHDARILVTGATSKPTRSTAAEGALNGSVLDADAIAQAVAVVAEGLDVNADTYANVDFRSHLLRVMTKRALESA